MVFGYVDELHSDEVWNFSASVTLVVCILFNMQFFSLAPFYSPLSESPDSIISLLMPLDTYSLVPTCKWIHAVIFFFLFLSCFTYNNGLRLHPSCSKRHYFILFYGWVVLHSVYIPLFLYTHWSTGT